MRLLTSTLLAFAITDATAKAVVHAPREVAALQPVESQFEHRDAEHSNELWKRRGGGGGGGGRGGGSGSSSSGGSSGSGGRGSSSSTAGGRTTTGSGPSPAYGGGKYYGGGASVPYKAGDRSPKGIAPVALVAGIGVGATFWIAGSYMYHYNHPYSYYNRTANQNQTKPVTCGCEPDMVCGCDENDDPQYLNDVVGDGTNLNATLVSVATVDGVQRLIINGTLPKGTTASGGDESPNAGAGVNTLLRNAGFWPVVAIVSAMVMTI